MVFKAISRDVLGYKVPDNAKYWRLANGNDEKVYLEYLRKNYNKTSFNPHKYDDGIYDISVDDYWTYYSCITDSMRPKFRHTKNVKFLKNSGFIMFISVTEKGTMSILHGGQLRKIKLPLQYYYEKMPEYGNMILQKFSKYWDALYSISNHIKNIVPDKKMIKKIGYAEHVKRCKNLGIECTDFETYFEKCKDSLKFTGKVHGCIVDLDYLNHIYINPYDGTVTAYTASSMYDKYAYKNLVSLIADKRPEMLQGFKEYLIDNSTALIAANSDEKHSLALLSDDEIDKFGVPVYDTNIYAISNKMKALQHIYDHHLITVWYDDILPHYERKKLSVQLLEGQHTNSNISKKSLEGM